MNSDLGLTLKHFRETKGLSQTNVAKSLTISRQAISRWENNRGYPDIDNLIELANLYDVSVDQLLGHSTEFKKPELTESELIQLTHSLSDTSSDNSLALILIIVVSSIVAPLGFILSPLILKLNKKRNAHYKIIIVLTIHCLYTL